MMPNGMPLDKSWLTGTYMYNQAFLRGDVDYSSAISVLIVVMGVVFSRIANTVFKAKDY
jgi:raffinose/stachyose/melibiose transport system permease protein